MGDKFWQRILALSYNLQKRMGVLKHLMLQNCNKTFRKNILKVFENISTLSYWHHQVTEWMIAHRDTSPLRESQFDIIKKSQGKYFLIVLYTRYFLSRSNTDRFHSCQTPWLKEHAITYLVFKQFLLFTL